MTQFVSKHQICREIFSNIYGEYPVNPALDVNVKSKFDTIRRQVTRTLRIFSKLFNFQYREFCEEDFHCMGKYRHRSHSFDTAVAKLVITEVTYRFSQSSRQLNTQRTKIAGYIANRQWHRISTDSLGVFFYPFFKAIEERHPHFEEDFKKQFSDESSINDTLFLYIDHLLSLMIS